MVTLSRPRCRAHGCRANDFSVYPIMHQPMNVFGLTEQIRVIGNSEGQIRPNQIASRDNAHEVYLTTHAFYILFASFICKNIFWSEVTGF